ncbi:alanyl-tRNA editing protein [Phytohalomonas tamaricis]|uniref:alanyl-tRNA editing protein n=1 Tax=Phytohalomonas tamaricis TaxID=2081032 RepID=UPI000D0B5A21|nr:alanyl-tRNA editing protein [Phytohalomonas tamaricis]
MTTLAFLDDAYLQQLATVITVVDGAWVETEATVFYAMGGGQPGDSGSFTGAAGRQHRVLDTRKGEAGRVCHQLEDDHGLRPGDTVIQALDWPRRYAHMRMHTALHLLSVAVPFGVTGGQIGADKGRLDFDLGETSLDKEQLSSQLNALIAANHAVSAGWIGEAELDANPELVKTMAVKPPRGAGRIRMVTIGDIDYQPCGGTHVARTAEIGPIRVLSIKNRGARNRRITLGWDEETTS